jgi:uncharacterized protein DUF6929
VRRAVVDPALSVRVHGTRELHYRDAAKPGDDRPPHVRAASGIAVVGGRLAVVQDDASFIALVGPGGALSIPLPRGRDGRRRFEDALGNKQDKLDLESCVVIAGELWAFGSGSTDRRRQIARVGDEVKLYDAGKLYRTIEVTLTGPINIEGVAVVDRGAGGAGDELWLFHRGNAGGPRTEPGGFTPPGGIDAGPAVVRFDRAAVLDAVVSDAKSFPRPLGFERYDLGAIDGAPLGFTDAIAGDRRVYYLAAAERSPNAVDDGPVLGSQLGVIDVATGTVRAAPLAIGGGPVKAEGLAFDPRDPTRGWVVIDPDDPDQPAPLAAIELVGPW